MLRGHVPPVEAGKTHEIVTSTGKEWGHFASRARSQRRACFLRLFLSQITCRSQLSLVRVD